MLLTLIHKDENLMETLQIFINKLNLVHKIYSMCTYVIKTDKSLCKGHLLPSLTLPLISFLHSSGMNIQSTFIYATPKWVEF